ncbi:MAG: CopG family transcriptional regulator [Ruminococcaceae bacterium]|nr:CopG family transcriptional regulator [Oscillospiraceae bacterium]
MAKFIARKPEKEVISMRISSDTLHILDEKSSEIGISRNELINQMILFALANMDDSSEN